MVKPNFYSDITGKYYNSVEEAEAAEKALTEKKERDKKIDCDIAFKRDEITSIKEDINHIVEEADAEISEAYQRYLEAYQRYLEESKNIRKALEEERYEYEQKIKNLEKEIASLTSKKGTTTSTYYRSCNDNGVKCESHTVDKCSECSKRSKMDKKFKGTCESFKPITVGDIFDDFAAMVKKFNE